jgi:hypothetical protein
MVTCMGGRQRSDAPKAFAAGAATPDGAVSSERRALRSILSASAAGPACGASADGDGERLNGRAAAVVVTAAPHPESTAHGDFSFEPRLTSVAAAILQRGRS